MKFLQQLTCIVALCVTTFAATPSSAIFTRARFTGPFHFTACGQPGSPDVNMVSSNIRYDLDFMPPGHREMATIVLVGANVPAICETDPLGTTCLNSFNQDARIFIPNPREFSFPAHAGLANLTFDLMAVSFSLINGQLQIAHTRVEKFYFHPCSSTVAPTISAGTGFLTAGSSAGATVPGTPANLVNHPAVAHWGGFFPYDRLTTATTVGVVAEHPEGIHHVDFQLNNGTVVSVTTPTNERKHAQNGYWVTIDPAQYPAGTLLEIRASVVPVRGKSINLAGPITPTSSPTGMHSMFFYADNNNTLPRATVHLSPQGNDTTGNGTITAPYATFNRATQHLLAVLGNKLSGGTISLAAGEYQFASGQPAWWDPNYTPDGYLTIQPNSGLDADQVRFTSRNANSNHIPKRLKIRRVTFMPPFDGDLIHDWSWPEAAMLATEGMDFISPGDLSRHTNLGGGFLYKGEKGAYYLGGLRGADSSNFVIDGYQNRGAGISYNDVIYQHSVRAEDCDQSRVDLPGTPSANLNHGDVTHFYGRAGNIFVRWLYAVWDIRRVQGAFVSTPKVGLVIKDSVVDMTKQEKYQFQPGAAAPIAGNQMAYIKNTKFNGGSNVFSAAAAPGGQFVAENLVVPFYSCGTKFSEDCPNLQSGVTYRTTSAATLGSPSATPSAPRKLKQPRPGSPSIISERQLIKLLRSVSPAVAKEIKKGLKATKNKHSGRDNSGANRTLSKGIKVKP